MAVHYYVPVQKPVKLYFGHVFCGCPESFVFGHGGCGAIPVFRFWGSPPPGERSRQTCNMGPCFVWKHVWHLDGDLKQVAVPTRDQGGICRH
jgi:hypothetical protein